VIGEAVRAGDDPEAMSACRARVADLMARFPVYPAARPS
jgi:hypothetical protein